MRTAARPGLAFALAAACTAACAVIGASGSRTDPAQAGQAFEMLASLSGRWSGTARSGDQVLPVEVSYELVSGGSVVMERLFRGTPHEMITMYHRDGERLLLTHYCTANNQPRMELVGWSAAPETTAAFAFVDATNHVDPGSVLMHDARIVKRSADHVQASWTAWKDGRADHTAEFELRRIQSLGY
jgi:hypothetical protein